MKSGKLKDVSSIFSCVEASTQDIHDSYECHQIADRIMKKLSESSEKMGVSKERLLVISIEIFTDTINDLF